MRSYLSELSREPDFVAPDLLPYDATDELLLDEAVQRTDGFSATSPGDVVVIGDRHGAITLGLTLPQSLGGYGLTRVRVFQDPILAEQALSRNAERIGGPGFSEGNAFEHHRLGKSLLDGATLILMQLPKSHDELEELAQWIALEADPGVTIIAGGRVKHMNLHQNKVFRKHFASVNAGLASRKSRIITAEQPLRVPVPDNQSLADQNQRLPLRFPESGSDPDLSFPLYSFGATFGGATLDHGSRLLLEYLPQIAREAKHIVDLGCGNGSLAVAAALGRPDADFIATDQSWGAVLATERTAQGAGVQDRVTVVRADGCDAVPSRWADLILVNPPFHSGQIVNEGISGRLIASAQRALRPGGTLLAVFNSHLGHRTFLERYIGPVEQIARNRVFTLVKATRVEN